MAAIHDESVLKKANELGIALSLDKKKNRMAVSNI